MVLDPEMDSNNRKSNNNKAAKVIEAFCDTEGLGDIFWSCHLDLKRFTHYQKKPRCAARLDRFYANFGLINQVEYCNITGATFSDHNIIESKFLLNDFKKGPGIWKLNTKLLEDDKCKIMIFDTLKELKQNYKHLPIEEWWEEMKSQMRKKLQAWGKSRGARRKENRDNLALNLTELLELHNKTGDDLTAKALAQITQKIEELEKEKVEGVFLRSRAQWLKEGEKSTKYFLNLENRNYTAKLMTKLRKSDNSIITQQKEILKEQQRFYEALYACDDKIRFQLKNYTGIKVSQSQKDILNANIIVEELQSAVFTMKDNKVPGLDGLPVEFYILIWGEIKDLLIQLYNKCKDMGQLNKTARQGIISLLPKGNKDPLTLKNWRPLTLLNIDYKILAKCLATRLKKCLPNLIGPQQTGFMEGRYIATNIVKTMNIVAYANEKRKHKVIMTIDFEKCFDRVSYEAIYGALAYFGIEGSFVQWIRLFYSNFIVSTVNAGYQSQWFVKGRSINQGCNISPYLFLLCSEVMAHHLLQNENIKGITVNGIKQVLAQFADDTVMFLNYDLTELEAVVKTLTQLSITLD